MRDSIPAPALLDIIRAQVLPVIEAEGAACVTLARSSHVDMVAAPAIKVIPRKRRGQGISTRASQNTITRWPKDHQISLRLPYCCFVFAGEADFYIGDAILQCPQNHGILVPPGTPLSDGSNPHWERPHLENAHSDILWIKFHPFGLECHTCHTRGSAHYGGGFGERSMVADSQFFTLGEMLMDELMYRRPGFEVLGRSYLMALVALMQRHLEGQDARPRQAFTLALDEGSEPATPGPEMTVRRVKQYIQNNLGKSFTLQDIAHATYISRSQLARLFREHEGQTIWEYVTTRRIEEAQAMLAETDVSVENVGRLIGFPNPSHFATRFTAVAGMPPSEFRERKRKNNAPSGSL